MPIKITKNLKTTSAFIIILMLALAVIYFFVFGSIMPPETTPKLLKDNSTGAPSITAPLGQIEYRGASVPLLWTDDNTDENMIIKSDRRYYDASAETEVFFSVANESGQEQSADIVFWFDNSSKSLAKVERIADGQMSNVKIPISNQIPSSNVQNRKDIKSYTNANVFNDTIAVGATANYRAVIACADIKEQSEFFIEAIGDQNGYGHLDPYLSSGLVGYWSFDGPDMDWSKNYAYDRSGGAYATGTMTNMSTSTSPAVGISGQALNFDGVDDYVKVDDVVSLVNKNQGSFSAWVFANKYNWGENAYSGGIIQIGTNVGWGNGIALTPSSASNLSLQYVNENVSTYATISNAPIGAWYHVAGTWTASTLSIYLNGQLAQSVNNGTTTTATFNQARIGSDALGTPNQQLWDGKIDEARVYNRALSASEIQELYRYGSARTKTNKSAKLTGPQNGLVGHWTFDGADMDWSKNYAYDRSGAAYATGTITNMSTSSSPVPGISGQALSFDGVDDLVSMYPADPIGVGTITACSWFKADSAGGALFGNVRFRIMPYGSGQIIVTSDNGSTYALSSTGAYSLNTWTHVCAVRLSTETVSIYVNGSLSGSANQANPIIAAGGFAFTIGTRGSAPAFYFSGSIDEVRVYNRALSASEIQDLYRTSAARVKVNSPAPTPSGLASGLVGYWSFNGPDINWAANTAYDRSGQNNNGIITNMSTTTSPVVGKLGQALNFDGVNDYVSAGNITATDGAAQASWSFWVKPSALISNAMMISKNDGNYGPWSWQIGLYGTSGAVFFDTANCNRRVLTTTNPLVVGAWSHVTVVYDGSQSTNTTKAKIYINSVLQVEGNEGADIPTSLGDASAITAKIGAETYDGSSARNYFNGKIDEVRVYNRALSASEIQELYKSGQRKVQPKKY